MIANPITRLREHKLAKERDRDIGRRLSALAISDSVCALTNQRPQENPFSQEEWDRILGVLKEVGGVDTNHIKPSDLYRASSKLLGYSEATWRP